MSIRRTSDMKQAIIFILLCWLSIHISRCDADDALILVKTSPSLILRLENIEFVRTYQRSLSEALYLCPLGNQDQNRNMEQSITISPLIVHSTKLLSGDTRQLTVPKCELSPTPSILFNKKENYYEIGYEVNFRRNVSNKFHPSQTFQNLEMIRSPTPSNPNSVWISVMTAKLKNTKKNAQQISYEITNGKYQTNTSTDCSHFDHSNWLVPLRWDSMLHKTNNSGKFSQLKGYAAGEKLVLRKLAPFEDFNSYGKQLAACSYLNIAPMWSSIAQKSWKTVEEFIRSVAKEFGRLQIISGTYGEMEINPEQTNVPWFDRNNKSVTWKASAKSYLSLDLEDGTNEAAVPSVFWKLVKFEYKWQIYGENTQFAILIVTYNNPFAMISPFHKNCSRSLCVENMWNVGNDNIQEGKTHCCAIDEEILKMLNIPIQNFPTSFDIFNIDVAKTLKNKAI